MSNMIKCIKCYKFFDSNDIMILEDEDEGEFEICNRCWNIETMEAFNQLKKEMDEFYNKQKEKEK